MWAELFLVDQKKLPYDHYQRIAVCSLSKRFTFIAMHL